MQGGQWAVLATVLQCLPLEETSPEGKEILIFLPIFMRKCSSCTIAKRKKGLLIILPAIWEGKVPLFPLQLTAGEKIKAQAKLKNRTKAYCDITLSLNCWHRYSFVQFRES